MAAFASCRRSGWVRVLVVILCALFIFATIATPPAYAVGETVALFGAAAVLSAAVAALGFKLSNDSDGIATLNKMVSDFAKEAWALNVLVVGNRINGLIDGMNYIKMAVHNGKTYLDERILAWCQQWLSNNGVYDATSVIYPSIGDSVSINLCSVNDALLSFSSSASFSSPVISTSSFTSGVISTFNDLVSHYSLDLTNKLFFIATSYSVSNNFRMEIGVPSGSHNSLNVASYSLDNVFYASRSNILYDYYVFNGYDSSYMDGYVRSVVGSRILNKNYSYNAVTPGFATTDSTVVSWFSNYLSPSFSSNDTGLSGTDTIGEDYKDKTLDQILAGLKTWAQDWYDAGADSATNTVAGAKDLPVTVGDQAATANPALNPDVVYNPPFSIPWPGVRSGETSSGAISDGKANADAAETATTDVAENQSVIDSLVNWALNYINPDTGLFSKFPLCVPYDAYLLVTSSLGVDAVGSDSIFGASPGDLDGVVSQDIETYSDFQPIINIKHDFQLDGATYPLELTIDLTPWQPLVTFFREGLALLLVAELIGAEFKRIRGH